MNSEEHEKQRQQAIVDMPEWIMNFWLNTKPGDICKSLIGGTWVRVCKEHAMCTRDSDIIIMRDDDVVITKNISRRMQKFVWDCISSIKEK